jgi:hypothetical protein
MASHPIPDAALDDRLAFIGTSGAGKTYSAGTAVEKLLHAKARVVVVDPLGVWWGLRLTADGERAGFPLVIFGGAHGDLPLTEHAGSLIGETAATMGESCIIDLSGLPSKAAERRFMLAFLDAIYRKADPTKIDPFHIVFDEADLWAPQRSSEPMLQSRMEEIVRRGRVKGFIPWLITQRPAVLSKDVLSQADGLIAFKLTASQDRDAIGAWIEGQADRVQGKEILASLPAMQRGEGVVWIPGRGVLETATFPTKVTFDSSRTPKRGEVRRERALKPLDLSKLQTQLSKLEEETKASDPKSLKAEIARLTRELGKVQAAAAAPDQEALDAAYRRGKVDGYAEGVKDGGATVAPLLAALGPLELAIAHLRGEAPKIEAWSARPPKGPRAAPSPRPAPAPVTTDGSVPAGCAKPLAALAGVYPAGMTEPQWATAAGYKRSGGTWGTYKSRLRGAGLIETKDGRWFATAAGAQAVGDVEMPPAPGPDLVRWWAAKLPGTSRMAELLIEAGPTGLDRETLAQRLHMSAAGGSFGTYLSRLASPGLIERRGGVVRLSPDVMP